MNNELLKLVQGIKDAEGLTLGAVIKKVEEIRVSETTNRADLKKLANALVALKKEVDAIPLTSEVKKLQKAISDAESRVQGSLDSEIKAVKTDIRNTESRLRQEIEDRIPDIVTVTEKVTEVAKELDEEEQKKVLDKVLDPEFVAKVRDVIENFEGDDRMDASKLKNFPQLQALNAGGGSNLSVFKDGGFVSSSTRLNFVGSGVTVSDEGGRTRVSFTGGGASTFLDLTDTPSAYTGQAGKVVAVTTGEDGLEFIAASGVGTVTSVAVSGSDGIEVDSGSPITAAGTIALGVNKTNMLTHLNVEDGAEVNTIDTVSDTSEIDLTITARALSASLVAGSIDETKLDASVNASLDLADSASQPGHTHTASDVTDFDTAVAANSAVAANTAKVTNATHTGDVTGATALTIADDVVTNAKLANVATATIKGRVTAATGDPEDLTAAQVRTLLNVEDGADVTDATNVAAAGAVMDGDFGSNGLMERTGAGTYGVVTKPTGAIVGTTDTQTLTNKRVSERLATEASTATPTINTDTTDYYSLTALATNVTSFTTNLSGTPTKGQKLIIEVTPTATRTVTWGASFEDGNVHTLPTEFTGTTTVQLGFMWNSITSKWRLVALDA